jgi:CRISPR type III-B/RAMP module RAMP protein Cmr6
MTESMNEKKQEASGEYRLARGPSLERLEHLHVYLYRIITRSHLTVGAGETADLAPVDKPIIRAMIYHEDESKRERIPYIPASSLHGVVRAWVEKALRSLEEPIEIRKKFEEFKIANPTAAENISKKAAKDLGLKIKDGGDATTNDEFWAQWRLYPNVCNIFWDHDRCQEPGDSEEGKIIAAWHKHIGRTGKCDVCRLFGHTGQRGRVRFTHAFPPTSKIPIDIITRVAINRYTGAADEGKLFDLEAVPPGVPFHFYVVIENAIKGKDGKEVEEQLLNYGFKAMQLQLATLGAHGTVGFGMVEPELLLKVKINPSIFKIEQKDFSFLDAAPLPADYDQSRFPKFFNRISKLVNPEIQPPNCIQVIHPKIMKAEEKPK